MPRCEGCGAVCHLQAQNIWLHVELNGEKIIIWDVGLSSLSITSGTREHKNVNLTSFHHPGHHILKCIRSPSVREQLALNAEDDNTNDCRAVVVIKIDAVVGYLPRETAKTVRSTVGILFMGFRYHSKLRSRHQSTCITCLRMCIDVAYVRICKL